MWSFSSNGRKVKIKDFFLRVYKLRKCLLEFIFSFVVIDGGPVWKFEGGKDFNSHFSSVLISLTIILDFLG